MESPGKPPGTDLKESSKHNRKEKVLKVQQNAERNIYRFGNCIKFSNISIGVKGKNSEEDQEENVSECKK